MSIKKAINLASKLHLGQVRKDDPALPFIRHPFSVAWILRDYTKDENVIIAGILHDTLEDVEGYTFAMLRRDFGTKVAKIVWEISEKRKSNKKVGARATWKKRKQSFMNNLKKASAGALLVCAADKIDNLQSLQEAYKRQGEKVWDGFNAGASKQMWFYENIAKILGKKLKSPITKELDLELKKLQKLFAKRKKKK